MKVLNFGSLNLDYVYLVDHFVQPGETISADSQTVNAGGKGLNQSVALARAGAEVYHAGCIGIGGNQLEELLQQNGVDTSLLLPCNVIQGNAVIQVDRDGQNCILLFGGSNQCITEEQIEKTLASFNAGDWLVLQNEINNLPLIVEKAHKRGMRIVLNPSPYNEKLSRVDFDKLDWLLVNEVEVEQLSGSKIPEEAWQKLHERYPKLNLLVTLGSDGSVAFMEEEIIRQVAFQAQVVDTTAAGDTYTGYFIAGLMHGRSICESMCLASMASGKSVQRAGAASSIPRLAEVEQALEGDHESH